jgi:hypothetical protein
VYDLTDKAIKIARLAAWRKLCGLTVTKIKMATNNPTKIDFIEQRLSY